MSKVTVDTALLNKLRDLEGPVELCDQAGHILGQFFPKLDATKHNLKPQISEEEIQRRKNSEDKTYATAEVLARLEKL
jgi:CRISPR/Cas system-associated endonuclease Cas1